LFCQNTYTDQEYIYTDVGLLQLRGKEEVGFRQEEVGFRQVVPVVEGGDVRGSDDQVAQASPASTGSGAGRPRTPTPAPSPRSVGHVLGPAGILVGGGNAEKARISNRANNVKVVHFKINIPHS